MSLPSDEEQELDDTLPGPSFSPGMMDIEGKIVSLLASLQIDKNRQGPVTDEDDDMLKEVQEKIQMLIRMESDHDRKKWFKKAYLASNRIREELYNLRRVLPKTLPPHSYFDRIQPVLQDIVSKSFEEEYRKVAIVLGLVDSLAELLIMEVLVHGTTPRFPEHKSIRKLIANALTNLTFGHGPSKKRLCSYPDFILTVVKLFREAKNLVQVYAGLIRNLSWMADSEMVACLNPCVSALAAAAVDARKASDEACVRAILSALWNLASHSTESKKAICDQPGCLQMLVSVLSTGTNPTVDIESASGILKYVSQYLANHSDHMDLRPTLVRALIMHLSSSSFTALSNVLGALGNLIAKDPHVQNEIRSDRSAMHQLTSLRDSNREDMSNLVKTVLNHLQQPAGFRKPYSNMSASVGVPSYGPPRERILNHRAVMASPGNPSPMAPQFASPATFVESQRCSSLPRHFARGGYAAPLGQVHHSPQFRPQPAFQPPQQMFAPVSEPEQQFGEDENLEVDDELDAASYAVDKCNASRRSLESELPSGWNSAPESVNTTANMSPVSAKELPDSPTHYAMERYKHEIEALQAQGLISTNHLNNIPMSFNGSDLSKNGGSDAATAVIEDYPTPTFPTSFGKMTAQIENDYAVLDTTSNDLLRMSIEASLPPATPRSSKRQKSPMDGAQLLAETMQSAMPQRTRSAQRGATAQSEKLLQDCIQSSMPSPSFSSTLPKNVKGGRSQLVTSTDRHENLGHPFAEVTSSVLFSNEEGSLRDANNLLHQDLRSESSDDDFENDLDGADVDTTLPMDCFDEEEMTIDCSTLSMGESRNSRSGILKPSRLPKPTYRPGVSPRVRPVIKPKPQTQAVISPYNYQKPRETKTKSPEAKPVVHSKTNTMLVTTV